MEPTLINVLPAPARWRGHTAGPMLAITSATGLGDAVRYQW